MAPVSSLEVGPRKKITRWRLFTIAKRPILALKVESPTDLLNYYQEVKERGLKLGPFMNHGFALSFFFQDPT
jgi:hypothetical protein